MPRVNLCADKRNENIISLIAAYKVKRRISTEELINKSGMKRATYFKRTAAPQTFTLYELRSVLDALNVPAEERREFL